MTKEERNFLWNTARFVLGAKRPLRDVDDWISALFRALGELEWMDEENKQLRNDLAVGHNLSQELSTLKAQMAGMVTLEQVEKALTFALGGKTEYTSLLMVAVRNNLAAAQKASQSTPTEISNPHT